MQLRSAFVPARVRGRALETADALVS